jgi:hypothetical protein
MSNPTRSTRKRQYQTFVSLAFIAGGLLPLLPAFADGTQAGQSITNTATATYTDPNNPNTPINSTSNPVVVTVAEVAGITVSGSGTSLATDVNNDGKVSIGDKVYYSYTVTNVGNDATQMRIPNLAATTGPATVSGPLEVSYDGGATWTAIAGSEVITPSKLPGQSVLVRVPVTIAVGAQPNDIVTVTIGDTPGNAQNQARNPNGGDIYTVDNPDAPVVSGEVVGAPVNGVREASDTQRVVVDSQLKTYTLAAVTKVRSGYNNAGTPAIADDSLSYDLSLKVEDTDPTGNNITPAALSGTTVPGLGANKYVLVSDAIPMGTELAAAPTPPAGWQVVYSTMAVATNANSATWTTAVPPLASVTRIGFVYDTTARGPIAPGTLVSGFKVDLKVKATAASPLTIANIAQLFGESPSAPALPGQPVQPGLPVYDESGDNKPSNFDDTGKLPPVLDVNQDGVPDSTAGVPNPLPPSVVDDGFVNTPTAPEQGSDPGNNNSGTGPGGEANLFTIQTPQTSSLLNGPDRAPDATGPDGTTATDFTNKSALVPPNMIPGSTLDPQPVGFTNSLINNGLNPGPITLVPQAPATPGDLPANTTVTLTYGSQSVTYTYNGTTFTPPAGGPIVITDAVPGTPVNYGVEVNLPPGTPLSTDTNKGFPVPIAATLDTTPATPGDEVTNVTIDRVYTGYLKLLKESRILPGTGTAPTAADGVFSTTSKTPAPGNIIEYRITYTNITEAQSGTGNVILNADKIVISEDGVNAVNNWAKDNDANTVIDTSNIIGSAKDSGASTIQFFNGAAGTTTGVDQTGTSQNTDVTKYVNSVTGTVTPQQARTFTFQRKVN